MIGAQNIVGKAAESGEDARVFSDAGGVFAQRDIACVMRRVLDPPMLSDGIRSHFCGDRAVGQIECALERGLPQPARGLEGMDRALDRDDGSHIGLPFGPLYGRGIEHGNGSRFMAIAGLVIARLNRRQRPVGMTSGLDPLPQGRLVVLELRDQMRVGGGRGFEGFFDNGWHRR